MGTAEAEHKYIKQTGGKGQYWCPKKIETKVVGGIK
jgi:hypothetical protein